MQKQVSEMLSHLSFEHANIYTEQKSIYRGISSTKRRVKKTSPMNASVLQTLGTLNNNLPL